MRRLHEPELDDAVPDNNPYSVNGTNSHNVTSFAPPMTWLVTVSCCLAVILRLSPIGGDIAYSFKAKYGVTGYLALSCIFHAVVLTPAIIFAFRNWRSCWSIAPKRLTAIFILTMIALAFDSVVIVEG